MSESIHGHQVMELMLEHEQGFSVESLIALIKDKFGEQARFHTCKAKDMNAEEIVSFLEQRGKLVPVDGGFSTSRDKICSH